METLLFKDSEVFVKERPSKLSEKQETEIWQNLAKEVVNNGWSDDDIDTIIEDLQSLSMSDSGYEMAKDLDGFSANGSYDIDTSFIEWLDMLDSDFDNARRENVKRWVKAHDIKPKYKIGTQLVVRERFSRSPELQVDKVIFVNGYYENDQTTKIQNKISLSFMKILNNAVPLLKVAYNVLQPCVSADLKCTTLSLTTNA